MPTRIDPLMRNYPRENAALKAQVVEYAKRLLLKEMEEASQWCWFAGWLMGCEYVFWNWVNEYAEPQLDQVWCKRIKSYSDACDGWFYWNEDEGDTTFVPMARWLEMYAEHEARRRQADGKSSD